jgi:hypothetical protein
VAHAGLAEVRVTTSPLAEYETEVRFCRLYPPPDTSVSAPWVPSPARNCDTYWYASGVAPHVNVPLAIRPIVRVSVDRFAVLVPRKTSKGGK